MKKINSNILVVMGLNGMLSKGHLETHPSGLRKEILFV